MIILVPLSMSYIFSFFEKIFKKNDKQLNMINPDSHSMQAEILVESTLEETQTVVNSNQLPHIDLQDIFETASSFKTVNQSFRINSNPHKERIESREQKKRIALLENFACQICNAKFEIENNNGEKCFRIDVDHIVEKSKGGGEEMRNLWVLCPNCHLNKTIGLLSVDINAKKVFYLHKEIRLHHDNHLFV